MTQPTAWAATTAYTVGAYVLLPGGSTLLCTTAGTSGATAPTAPGIAHSVTDGTATWVQTAVQIPTPGTEPDPVLDPGVDTGDETELTTDDVANYTGGRLAADDPETARMLAAALVAARREVGWHVSPVFTGVTMVRNGPGGRKLRLPTKNIVHLGSIVDAGTSLNVDQTTAWPPGPDVTVDAEIPWLLHRHRGQWSHWPGAITVVMDHGFDTAQAADWRQAILSIVDQMSTLVAVGRPDSELASKQIDDVVYRWSAAPALPSVEPILQKYRLTWGVA